MDSMMDISNEQLLGIYLFHYENHNMTHCFRVYVFTRV